MDLQPTLKGKLLTLEPLLPQDYEALFQAASDPQIWKQHPNWDRYKPEEFQKYFDLAIASKGAFKIIDNQTQQVIGSTRYYDFNPSNQSVCIGYTFLACKYWGGTYNREKKDLLLKHAFRFVKRVILEVGSQNVRSQKAVLKIGGIHVRDAIKDGTPHKIFEIQRI